MIAEDIEADDINGNKQSYDADEGLPNGTGIKTKPPLTPKRNGFLSESDGFPEKRKSKWEQNTPDLQIVGEYMSEKIMEDTNNADWRDLANILDRIFLCVYSSVTVIVTLVFLLQCATQ